MKQMPSIQFIFTYSQWRLKKLWQDISQLDLIACAVVLLPLLIIFFVNLPLNQYLEMQKKHIKILNSVENTSKPIEIQLQPLQSQNLSDQFIDFLPEESSKNQQLFNLHELIKKDKLVLEHIHYQNEIIKGTQMIRLKVQIRLIGTYNQQRKFLFSLLNGMPNLAIHQLTMSNNLEQNNLDLELHLYYKTLIQNEVIQDDN